MVKQSRPMTAAEARLVEAAIKWGDDGLFDPTFKDHTQAIDATYKLSQAVAAVVKERQHGKTK